MCTTTNTNTYTNTKWFIMVILVKILPKLTSKLSLPRADIDSASEARDITGVSLHVILRGTF